MTIKRNTGKSWLWKGSLLPSTSEREPLLQPSDIERTPSPDADSQNASIDSECTESTYERCWDHQEIFKLLSVVFDFFVVGVYQSALGALIPEIERFYHLGDGATASLFVVQTAGYVCATTLLQQIHLRFGRRGIALISPFLRLSAAAMLSTGPSFPVALLIYCLLGFGTGLADACWCTWASALPYNNVCQGMMHGAFSAGCVAGPVTALAIVKKGFGWYGFYAITVSLLNNLILQCL